MNHLTRPREICPREPLEIRLGRVLSALLEILECSAEETFDSLVEQAGTDRRNPQMHAADAALQVALACRRLNRELRHYHNTHWWEIDDQSDADDGSW